MSGILERSDLCALQSTRTPAEVPKSGAISSKKAQADNIKGILDVLRGLKKRWFSINISEWIAFRKGAPPFSAGSLLHPLVMKIIKALLLTVISFPLLSTQSFSEPRLLRIGITAVLIEQNINTNHKIAKYIGDQLNIPVETIYRRSYRDIIQMIGRSEIDIAFICGYAYVEGKDRFGLEIVASPTLDGKPFYRSYVIVPSTSEDKAFFDLRRKKYALTDPLSNSGYLVPLFWLAQNGENPDDFFEKIVYTRAHYNSIEAVAMRIVSGASVDSYIWEHARKINYDLVSKTKVIKESELFPFPPVVARKSLKKNIKDKIREVLLSMSRDPAGSRILKEIGLDGFVAVTDDFYNPIRARGQKVKGLERYSKSE